MIYIIIYNHGGGSIKYEGKKAIGVGVFKYKSPCPPSGYHTYEWIVTALDKDKKKIGTAKVRKNIQNSVPLLFKIYCQETDSLFIEGKIILLEKWLKL